MTMKKILLAIAIILIALCCSFAGLKYNDYFEYSKKSDEVLARISGELGVAPSWESVESKIYCDIMAEGKTLGEIKSELSEITLISVSVVDQELRYYTIYFIEPYNGIDNVGMAFDSEYRLTYKFRRLGIGDVGAIECP